MERADQKLFTLAQRRNESIPLLIANKLVYTPPVPEKTERMRGVARHFGRSFRFQGIEYLVEAVKVSENAELMITQDHKTDLDHAMKRHIFEMLGLGDFANRIVYPSGLKMDERWYISRFMGAEHTVRIATPGDLAAAADILSRDKEKPFLEEDQRQIFSEYKTNLNNLMDAAEPILEDLTSQGYITGLYTEATRSRHPRSYIQRAPKSIALYTRQKDDELEAFAFPMSVGGLERVLPPNKLMRFWEKADLEVVFGKHYPFSEVWDARRAKALKAMGAEKADYMNGKIAVLNPRWVDPRDLYFYKRVLVA